MNIIAFALSLKADAEAKGQIAKIKIGYHSLDKILETKVKVADAEGNVLRDEYELLSLPENAAFIVEQRDGVYSRHTVFAPIENYLSGRPVDLQVYPSQDHADHKVKLDGSKGYPIVVDDGSTDAGEDDEGDDADTSKLIASAATSTDTTSAAADTGAGEEGSEA